MSAEHDRLEEVLRENLISREKELQELWQQVSDHWGYKDPVYRFYHQSYKVFHLQRKIAEIVAALKGLVPGQDLHPAFEQITQQGTGKPLMYEINDQWLETTRRILEAFFHARYFLEMACRHNREPREQPYSSGWAALLTLYRLW